VEGGAIAVEQAASLETNLERWAGSDPARGGVAQTVIAITGAAAAIAALVAEGALSGALGAVRGLSAQGELQKELDIRANDLLIAALRTAPVAIVGSEEADEPVFLDRSAPLAVALDPLDGSSNIDTNSSIGTIFSILPLGGAGPGPTAPALLQPGTRQLAAGYVIYGPHTDLVLTLGAGTQIYTLDPRSRRYRLATAQAAIPPRTCEFAINASNRRHWDDAVRTYIDDCLKGADGPRGVDFNMRWTASLVAEAHRILARGGIYLYPSDSRRGYGQGRLRLVYEANPIGWIIEQSGGAASTGRERVLELKPSGLHQRTPFVFGSRDEVARLDRYHSDPYPSGERSPLFVHRGLFRT
jgi:fructose-1,6-bisphosphatase I